VLEVIWQCFFKDLEFVIVHGFNNEFLVVRKEEERSRLALRLSSIESLVSVPFSAQRVLDNVFVNIVHFSELLEDKRCVLKDGDFFIDRQDGLSTNLLLFLFLQLIRSHANCSFGSLQKLNNNSFISNILVSNKVFVFGLVPHFRILDFDAVQSLNS
jgi:hypothetical protein